jgi:regulator of protease activity HflC (stomatin/prohibitin superfamily)
MLFIGFFKGQPTEHILKYVGGQLTREGPGLAFYYLGYKTQIVAVPTSSMDGNFVFSEVTNNFQAVTLQGQFTYRIHNPHQAAALLNFTIDPRQRTYLSNDPERLPQRVTNVIQMETHGEIQKRSLEETLRQYETIAATVLQRVRSGALLEPLGVELLSVYFLSVQPTPEVARALEAEYREGLLRKADEAVYARRAAAVEEERTIKEKELSTETALEQQRQQLIALQGDNALQEAENRGKALERERAFWVKTVEMELAVYRTLEPRTLLAMALKEMGQNAAKVGNLTITSEMLASLLNGQPPARQE